MKRIQQELLPLLPVEPPHWEWADAPTECIFVQSQDFKSLALESRVPFEAYAEFMLSCDMTSAYAYHRKVLQILQSRAPRRWVLKMPSHALHIRWALAAFPDARASCGPTATRSRRWRRCATRSRSATRACSRSPTWTTSAGSTRTSSPSTCGARWRSAPSSRRSDSTTCSCPISCAIRSGEIRRVYAWLGAELAPEVEARMRAWLAGDAERQARRPRYALEDFGLSRETVAPLFEEYIERFPALAG